MHLPTHASYALSLHDALPICTWQGWHDYVAFLYSTGSITEHTQVWWSIRPHLAYPTVEIRICDGQPDLADATSLAALCYALADRKSTRLNSSHVEMSYAVYCL